jgi:enoyl-CoA hydratase
LNDRLHTIAWSTEDRIGLLELNQPPSNHMTTLFFDEMNEVTRWIEDAKYLRAVVITGTGRHFSSGADLDGLLERICRESCRSEAGEEKTASHFLKNNYLSLSFFEALTIPVISAIRGVCLGSALELAMFSHFRFCGEDAVFGLPETTFNLMPGMGGIKRFAELAGKARAMEYILTGKTFPAEEALESGIIDCIFPKRKVLEMSIAFAQSLPEKYNQELKKLYLFRYHK